MPGNTSIKAPSFRETNVELIQDLQFARSQ